MKRSLIFAAVAIVSLPILVIIVWRTLPVINQPTPPPEETTSALALVEEAIRLTIEEQEKGVPILFLFETRIEDIQISADGNWATAWLTPVDQDTSQVVPTEPGLVIVKKEDNTWHATLPSDPRWVIKVQSIPTDLIDNQQKIFWIEKASIITEALSLGIFSGYLLPWAGGETMRLTQSVGHDRYTPSGNAHFSFDFATGNYPSGLFNVHASRSGFVKQARWSQPNGDPGSPGNYIVLEDPTTSPPTYQLYLHFAQNSIPPELQVVGAPVYRGQFLGVADDTGVSSGNHLHFMVHTNAYSYWGTSVDITFDDVSINGGRPRITTDLAYCKSTDICDVTQSSYISGNFISSDHDPPRGGITEPYIGTEVKHNLLQLSGWATDDVTGLASAQFLARYNGTWHTIEPIFTNSPFNLEWDLCTARVPDGPVSLALQLRDIVNNTARDLPGLTHFYKNYSCPLPPPTCIPTADQVALFADPDFKGDCVILNAGDHITASLNSLGDDNADSIQIGANVWATAFIEDDFQSRSETFIYHDSNLSDNRVGANTISSLIVQPRSVSLSPPAHTWPDEDAIYETNDSLSLVWRDVGGATQFQARLLIDTNEILVSDWQAETVWHLSGLDAGTYSWQVRSRNNNNTSNWSTSRSLLIQTASPTPISPLNIPYIDTFESLTSNWTSSNYWVLTNLRNHTSGGAMSWFYDTGSDQGYDTGTPNSAHLTSPPIHLPAGSTPLLQFWYLYETEDPKIDWDQRWVQVSIDGGPFINLRMLGDDVPNFWLRSSIPLSAYVGHEVQIRFYFATLDELFNNFIGWTIDDVSITSEAPSNCSDNDNNSFLQAGAINYGITLNGFICPGADIDYFKFQAQSGDKIGVRINAKAAGSNLDSYLYLLDSDGTSILAENDDQVLYQRTDSFLHYRILRKGTYYIKIRAWDHPSVGGMDYPYSLTLYRDDEPPTGRLIYPKQAMLLPKEPIHLDVEAQDRITGISHVQFLWHSSDWQNTDWIVVGDDWDGTDGWSLFFDLGAVSDASKIAIFVKIYDWAGNWIGSGFWNGYQKPLYFPLIFNR